MFWIFLNLPRLSLFSIPDKFIFEFQKLDEMDSSFNIKYQERMEHFKIEFCLQFQAFIQVTREKIIFSLREASWHHISSNIYTLRTAGVSQLLFKFQDGERDLDFHSVGSDWQILEFFFLHMDTFSALTKRRKKLGTLFPLRILLFFSFFFFWLKKQRWMWMVIK